MKKLLIATALLSAFSFSAAAKAPFGFTWGESISKYGSVESNDLGGVVIAKSAPKSHSMIESYIIFAGKNEGLQMVKAIGKDIIGDAYGIEGKAQYNKFKAALKKSGYKENNKFEYIGSSLYKDADEFYECLNYDGCGSYFWIGTDVEGTLATISIESAGRRGSGFIKLSFDSPKWSGIIDSLNAAKDAKDEDAF